MKNTRRNSQQFTMGPVTWIIVFFAFVGMIGLIYVWFHNQEIILAEKKKGIETQLAEVRKDLASVRSQYAELTNRSLIMTRLAAIRSNLVEIPEDRIVRVPLKHGGPGEGVRAVSNPSSPLYVR